MVAWPRFWIQTFPSFSTILYLLVRNIYELNLPIPISFCIYVFSSKYMVGNSTTEFHLSATMHATSALRVRIFTWPDRHLLVPKSTIRKEDVHTSSTYALYYLCYSAIFYSIGLKYAIYYYMLVSTCRGLTLGMAEWK